MDSVFGKSYKELIQLKSFKERYEYLRIGGLIGERTFGGERYLNQALYKSPQWRSFRNEVIIRDGGCDMAMEGYDIVPVINGKSLRGRGDYIIIHHINPLTIDDIANNTRAVFDINNVVCVSPRTHRAIHFGDASLLPQEFTERKPGDHCPWLTETEGDIPWKTVYS